MKYVYPLTRYVLLLVLLFGSLGSHLSAQILINEFSASNKSDYIDNDNDYEDWIELYNAGNSSVNLAGYYLSDKLNNPTKWEFPSGISIGANQRIVIFASDKNEVNGSFIHTSFKLTQTKQEYVVLSNPQGELLDAVQMLHPTQGNHSRGRLQDGAAEWGVFENPSPKFPNSNGYTEYTTKPVFSQEAGFYTGGQFIEIFAESNATIRYTLDGTTPRSNSPIYNGPISVTETTIIRAKAFSNNSDLADSFVETNTFFINEFTTLPVLSLADEDYESTLFAFKEEINTSLEYFDDNRQFAFEMDGDMRGHGNDSWFFDQKGMRFYTRDEYGSANNIEYPLIPSTPRDEYDVIIIRALGSDNYPGAGWRPSCHVRDPFLQTLSYENGLHLDTRKHSPVLVFINGEYWGIYSFRERIDSDFTKYYYDQSKSNVDMLEYWGGLEARYGDSNDWVSLYNYMTSNDLSIPSNFAYVEERMDLMSVIDYSILNTFTVNTDWLNWNTKWWHGTEGEGVGWRYCLWDMDNTFNLGENYTGLPTTTFNSDPCDVNSIYDDNGPNIGHVAMLLALMENDDFKKLYFERYAELMNTVFTCDNLINHLDSLLMMIEPEMPRQIQRWGGTINEWQGNVDAFKEQILGKCTIVGDQLVDCYEDEGLEGPYTINIKIEPEGAGNVVMNEIPAPNYPWDVTYFGGLDVNLISYPNDTYTFSHWEVNTNPFTPDEFSNEIALTLNSNDQITAFFTEENPCLGTEIMATIEGITSICEGESTTLLVPDNFTTYEWSTEETAAEIAVSEAGIYSVIVSNPAGCTATASIEVIYTEQPQVEIIGTTILCENTTTDLSIEGDYASILWSTQSNTASTEISEAGIYSVTVTNELGCSNESFIEVENSIPSEFSLVGGTNLCEDQSTTLTCMVLSGFDNYTYNWSTGATGQSIDVMGSITFGFVQTYSVTVTDQNGCDVTQSIEVETHPNPEIEFVGTTAICEGQETTISTNEGYENYIWSVPNEGNTITITDAGDYEVTVVDALGCTNSSSFSITESEALEVAIIGNTSICSGETTSISIDGDFDNYLWSNDLDSPSIQVSESGTYSVTVSNTNACTGVATQEISVFEEPVFELQGNPQYCQGESTTLATSTPNALFETYIWNTNETTQSISISTPGYYCLTITDVNGCTSSSDMTTEYYEMSTPEIAGSTTFCAGGNTTLSVQNFDQYYWSNEATTANIIVEEAGIYAVTVVDANGCTGEQNIEIQSSDALEFSIQGASSFCEGSSTILNVGEGFENYSWSNESTNSTLEVNEAGIYAVTVVDASGCSGEQSIEISQNENINFAIDGITSICEGNSTILSVPNGFETYFWSNEGEEESIEITSSGNYSVTVSDAQGCTGVQNIDIESNSLPEINIEGASQICSGSTSVLNTNNSFQSYLWSTQETSASIEISFANNYSLTVTDENGCSNENSFLVEEFALPLASINAPDTFCEGTSIEISASGDFESYEWSTGSSESTTNISESGNYSLIITDENGCTSQNNINIESIPNPIPSILGDLNFCLGSSTLVETETDFVAYEWSTGASTPQIEISESGTYSLNVIDENACEGSTEFEVNSLETASSSETIQLCFGESYNGNTYFQNTSIAATFPSSFACDSLHTIYIEVLPEMEVTLAVLDNCNGFASVLAQTNDNNVAYFWSNGSTSSALENVEAGNYAVTISNSFGCSQTDEITFETAPPFSLEMENNPILCSGDDNGAIFIEPLGGFPPYTAQWSNGVQGMMQENLSPGVYSVLLTDSNACQLATSVNIQSPAPLEITFLNSNSDNGITTTALTNGGTAPYQFQWSNGSNQSSIQEFVQGIFFVTITDANGCNLESSVDNSITSSYSISDTIEWKVFPNPTNGLFSVQVQSDFPKTNEVLIYNTLGQLIQKIAIKKQSFNQDLNLENQPNGTYFLVLVGDYGKQFKRIVKQ